jgi:hypothetical protein
MVRFLAPLSIEGRYVRASTEVENVTFQIIEPNFSTINRSMESPKRKRISDANAGVLMIDQVKPAILEGTAVRFDPLSKGKGIK